MISLFLHFVLKASLVKSIHCLSILFDIDLNLFDKQLIPHLSLLFTWKLNFVFRCSFWMLNCRLIHSSSGILFFMRSYNEIAVVYFWNCVGVALLYFLWRALNDMSLSSSLRVAPDAENNLLFKDPLRDGKSHTCEL